MITRLLKAARPLDWRWQRRTVRNIATFPELNDFSLALLFLDHCKCSIGKVEIALYTCLEATSPPNHVHESALVAVGIRNAERVDKAVPEGRKSHA